MLLGPVFRYELYSIGRRARYFWLRGLFGAVLLLFMWTSYEGIAYRGGTLSIDQSARLAAQFFASFAWLALLAVLMVTPALSAGVIATERERRTIEYLFATDLSNAEIILSKLLARLLLLGMLLITALPILAIFRLMGGIPGDRLLAAFAILASTGVVVTAASIAVSVWSPRGRDALGRVYLVLLAVLLVPIIVWGFTRGGMIASTWWFGQWLSKTLEWLLAINPLWSLSWLSWNAGAIDMTLVWRMLVGHAVLSVALIALAVSAVRRVHLRSVGGAQATKRGWRWTIELPRWRRPLGNRPMLWKEIFARTAATRLGILGRVAGALVVAGFLWGLGYSYLEALDPNSWLNFFEETALGIGSAIGSGALMLCGARAASLVTYEKERDTWTSILATPMLGREIYTAKLLGNLYAFRWLGAVLLLVWGLAVTLNPAFLFAVAILVATLLLLAVFASLVGLIYSLRLSSSLRASAATMGTLFFVGGGYIFCCCMPFMLGGPPAAGAEYFAFSSCAPMLLVAPGEFVDSGHVDEELISNYVLGVIWYSFLTGVLWASLDAGFDRWSGRVTAALRDAHT